MKKLESDNKCAFKTEIFVALSNSFKYIYLSNKFKGKYDCLSCLNENIERNNLS